jgi:hypothetical protein
MRKIKVKPFVEIGCHKYSLFLDKEQSDHSWDGTTLHDKEKISINPDQPKVRLTTCYLHEVVHLISRVSALELPEDTVWRLSEGLGEVFVRNLEVELDFSEVPNAK